MLQIQSKAHPIHAHLLACFVLAGVLLTTGAAVHVAGESASDGWRFDLEPYVWTPGLGGVSGTGSSINVGFTDVLQDLNFMAMGKVTASKNKFSVFVDAINIKLNGGDSSQYPIPISGDDFANSPLAGLPPGTVASVTDQAKAVLKGWVVSSAAGYELIDNERGSLHVLAGARYLSLDVTTTLSLTASLTVPGFGGGSGGGGAIISGTDTFWDGIVGVSGKLHLDTAKKIYFSYYGDVGTGDTDLTWSVQGTFGYRINDQWDVRAGYRYLRWNFESGAALANLHVRGPQFGVNYRF
jgi:hypothetical protein